METEIIKIMALALELSSYACKLKCEYEADGVYKDIASDIDQIAEEIMKLADTIAKS